MTENLNEIEREINEIQQRNVRVEIDKAWETSWTRKILVAVTTYLLIVVFMFVAKFESPFIGAIIPTIAYLISMNSLPYFKKRWMKKKMIRLSLPLGEC